MTEPTPLAASEDVLRLVQQALNEFDSVTLEATLRRAVRIANLVGDTFAAIRLSLELKPSGGYPPANQEMTSRLMADPDSWDVSDGIARQAFERWLAERRREDDLILSYSVTEMEFWRRERLPSEQVADDQFGADLANQSKMVEFLTRARHHAFTYLCQWERQLTFAVNQSDALTAVSRRVDSLLASRTPEVLDQFNVAFRRLREAASRDSNAEAAEELSQALASCRRILKAVVDAVQPADPTKPKSSAGQQLTDMQYKNRLFEYLKKRAVSKSFQTALIKDGESLYARFNTIDALSSKGVHAQVALDEAEFCALHTYVLAGELALLAERN